MLSVDDICRNMAEYDRTDLDKLRDRVTSEIRSAILEEQDDITIELDYTVLDTDREDAFVNIYYELRQKGYICSLHLTFVDKMSSKRKAELRIEIDSREANEVYQRYLEDK